MWTAKSELENAETSIVGYLGAPVTTPYSAIGPYPIGIALALFVIITLVPWPRRS